MEKDKNKITFKLGCTIPIIALFCLLAVLEVIKWKTALIIGLCLFIIPLVVWLVVLLIVALVGGTIGVATLIGKIRK